MKKYSLLIIYLTLLSGNILAQTTIGDDIPNIKGPAISYSKDKKNLVWPAKNFWAEYYNSSTRKDTFAFISSMDGKSAGNNLYITDVNGRPSALTESKNITEVCFSPNGKYLAYVDSSSGKCRVFYVTSNGKALPQEIDDDGLNETNPRFSRDGSSIFFVKEVSDPTNPNVDAFYIYKYNIVSGTPPARITKGLSFDILHNSDGLIFTRINPVTNKGELYRLDLNSTRPAVQLFPGFTTGVSNPSVSIDDKIVIMQGEPQNYSPPTQANAAKPAANKSKETPATPVTKSTTSQNADTVKNNKDVLSTQVKGKGKNDSAKPKQTLNKNNKDSITAQNHFEQSDTVTSKIDSGGSDSAKVTAKASTSKTETEAGTTKTTATTQNAPDLMLYEGALQGPLKKPSATSITGECPIIGGDGKTLFYLAKDPNKMFKMQSTTLPQLP